MRKDGKVIVDGDPTEGALLMSALKAEIHRDSLLKQFTIQKEYPFDSGRKMMSVIVKDENGKQFVITKGAPDVLAEKCESILWEQKKRMLNGEIGEEIQATVQQPRGASLTHHRDCSRGKPYAPSRLPLNHSKERYISSE